jgi:hypothetical protein
LQPKIEKVVFFLLLVGWILNFYVVSFFFFKECLIGRGNKRFSKERKWKCKGMSEAGRFAKKKLTYVCGVETVIYKYTHSNTSFFFSVLLSLFLCSEFSIILMMVRQGVWGIDQKALFSFPFYMLLKRIKWRMMFLTAWRKHTRF